MNRQVMATILGIAFISLTLCGWGFFMLESGHGMAMTGMIEHAVSYNELIMSMSVQVFVTLLLILLASLLSSVLSSDTLLEYRTDIRSTGQPGERLFWRPLQLAFSDGILNSKAY